MYRFVQEDEHVVIMKDNQFYGTADTFEEAYDDVLCDMFEGDEYDAVEDILSDGSDRISDRCR